MAVKGWIDGDESAKEMFSRVLIERPFLLLPPLHRLPLRVGNVVELVGPSPSAKTHILMQAAIDCILPKEWNGVKYGGLGRLVMFIDLDCRFDVSRLSHLLKNRIMQANGSSSMEGCENKDVKICNYDQKKIRNMRCDEELFALCMRRFLYVRCYDSLQFLATLKTLHYQLQKQRETQGISVHILMIDSIGAFYWVDRLSSSLHLRANNRKGISLQNVSETVVQEIKNLMMVHPVLVMATKATILGYRSQKRLCSLDASLPKDLAHNKQQLLYSEYMPSLWQSFVTHRLFLRATDEHISVGKHHNWSVFSLEWLLPPLDFVDNFIVTDAGVYCSS